MAQVLLGLIFFVIGVVAAPFVNPRLRHAQEKVAVSQQAKKEKAKVKIKTGEKSPEKVGMAAKTTQPTSALAPSPLVESGPVPVPVPVPARSAKAKTQVTAASAKTPRTDGVDEAGFEDLSQDLK